MRRGRGLASMLAVVAGSAGQVSRVSRQGRRSLEYTESVRSAESEGRVSTAGAQLWIQQVRRFHCDGVSEQHLAAYETVEGAGEAFACYP